MCANDLSAEYLPNFFNLGVMCSPNNVENFLSGFPTYFDNFGFLDLDRCLSAARRAADHDGRDEIELTQNCENNGVTQKKVV